MNKITNELLFLVEFVVDEVNLEFFIQKQVENYVGDTCVLFQFLDNTPISICEADFAPNKKNFTGGCGGCSTVKSGKSCLFSLTQEQIEKCLQQFTVYVEVVKKLSGKSGEKIQIGESLISILKPFKNLVTTYGQTLNTSVKAMKDCFRLTNSTGGDLVGSISIYIRLSCFGKIINTQFQMNFDTNTAEFKNKEGHYMLKSKKKKLPKSNIECENVLQIQNNMEPPGYVSIMEELEPFCKYRLPNCKYQEDRFRKKNSSNQHIL